MCKIAEPSIFRTYQGRFYILYGVDLVQSLREVKTRKTKSSEVVL